MGAAVEDEDDEGYRSGESSDAEFEEHLPAGPVPAPAPLEPAGVARAATPENPPALVPLPGQAQATIPGGKAADGGSTTNRELGASSLKDNAYSFEQDSKQRSGRRLLRLRHCISCFVVRTLFY